MTKPGYRLRLLIIDRSGSIASLMPGQQTGFDELLSGEAALPGEAAFSLWDFDSEIRCIASHAPLSEVQGYKIEPRGLTALNDAIGRAVTEEGAKLAALPEDQRPEDVTVIVSTDGLNTQPNQEWTTAKVHALLAEQQAKYGWRVLFLGTNQDAIQEAGKYSVASGQAVNFTSSSTGARNSWVGTRNYLSRVPLASAAGGQGLNYSAEERELAESGEEPENAGN